MKIKQFGIPIDEPVVPAASAVASVAQAKVSTIANETGVSLNELAKRATGDYLLFIKPHIKIDANAIEILKEDLDRDLSIAVVAPKIVNSQGEPMPVEFAFVEDECKRRPLDVFLRPVNLPDAPTWRVPPGDLAAVNDDAFLVRKTAFWGVGGWPEDVDEALRALFFSLSIREHHWRVTYERESCAVSTAQAATFALTAGQSQELVNRFYGKVLPHGYRTSDGIIRGHPWWPIGLGRYGVEHQRVQNVFETAPARGWHTPGSIPGERCSVVIVTYNSMKTIQACIRSVLEHSGTFDEVIVVDNASRDATPQFLKNLEVQDVRLKVILSEENLGFSEGSNVGIREANGEYIVLLNPDTEVPEGWLARMRHYFSDPRVGAVGPLSNYVAGLQQVPLHFPVNISSEITPAQVQEIAARINARRGVESKLLIGFCMMMRKSALDEIGLLDAELFLGCDDLDMSWRLRTAGYKLLIASDVFVLHEGHVSFNTEPGEITEKLNQESVDALARKLARHYGEGKVPSALELWGIEWFSPSEEASSVAA